MKRTIYPAALSLVALAALPAHGQQRPALPPPPAPLLYVRIAGPDGMKVTFYQGRAAPRTFPAPVTVGVRPGYVYRVKLTGFPDQPKLALYPALEVYGSLHLPPKLNAADYPAPVVFRERDVERVTAAGLLTKVVYLEDPEKALPEASKPGEPASEAELPAGRDLWAEGRELGRPLLLWRLGEREVSEDELAAQSVPGTVLFPGEKALGCPCVGPWLPWCRVPFYDPVLGPRLGGEECFHDGGDLGPPAGLDGAGRLRGLDAGDTVAEYADASGRKRLSISNRVCLCVPRFAVLSSLHPLARLEATTALDTAEAVRQHALVKAKVPSRENVQREQLGALKGRERPSSAVGTQATSRYVRVDVLYGSEIVVGPAEKLATAGARLLTDVERTRLLRQMELARALSQKEGAREVEQREGTAVVGRVEGTEVTGSVATTRDFTLLCEDKPCIPDKPLLLIKWADANALQVGDVVTFYLKFTNLGGKPITDVAVSDSLTGRLEYVAGSAKSSRNAVFTTQENEAGSAVLRWEVSGSLQPGESGVVSFKARIR